MPINPNSSVVIKGRVLGHVYGFPRLPTTCVEGRGAGGTHVREQVAGPGGGVGTVVEGCGGGEGGKGVMGLEKAKGKEGREEDKYITNGVLLTPPTTYNKTHQQRTPPYQQGEWW